MRDHDRGSQGCQRFEISLVGVLPVAARGNREQPARCRQLAQASREPPGDDDWVALLVQRCLSHAASLVLCVYHRVKDPHTWFHYSPRV